MSSDLERLTLQQLREITDDFSEKRVIGGGTFGKVFKGVHTSGEEIAVKLFRSMGFGEHEFENNLRILVRLKHQNIVRLVAFCDETESVIVPYEGKLVEAVKMHKAICLPYAHYGSLQKHISDESHGHDWPTRYRIIKGTCEGLKHLHHGSDHIILHLDIKPDNILLDSNMQPKLADFGLSRIIDESDEMKTMSRIGTPGYIPPEYIRYQIISSKFDIFSLGVVMIKIVAGAEGYRCLFDMSNDEFINLVLANWRRRLRSTFRGSTLDAYCEQVKRCTEIALLCLEERSQNRPDTVDITLTLNKTETHKGFEDRQEWKMSFKDLENITDNFKKENVIGNGANGVVYKGKLANGELVAVKRLKNDPTEPNDLANRWKQIESEGHLRNIEHENIVRLVGFCHEAIPVAVVDNMNPGETKIVDMTHSLLCYELLSNGSLEDMMRNDKFSSLDWQTRYSVIQGICKGLHYLHQECHNAPIVHRDLKPGNVLLDDNMVPKLADFGISRMVPKTQPHLTVAVGSRGYMAPETTRVTRASEITPKSDIYSLGVLILEIVTGRKCPDHDESGRHYIEKVREAQKQNSYVEFEDRFLQQVKNSYVEFEDRYLQQVKNWISIGLRCTEELPETRPHIEHIMHFLETESANSVNTHEGKVSKISFKELEDITDKFSAPYAESIFGAVYKGTRVNGVDIFVIKLKEQMRPSPAQFEDEVNRMSFKHTNILQLKGYCEEIHAGQVRQRFLCYEFFQESLEMIIYGAESLTQLDWEARHKIIKGICQALKYLHEECYVHMGITATNIWLDNEMVPKLGACGLSRFFTKDQIQIYNKENVESRLYVGQTKLTTKSDIYSLGVLILEIVTAQICTSSDYGSVASFIANIREDRKQNSYVASRYPSLEECFLQQVKSWISIGLRCTEELPERRPSIQHIMNFLETESANSADTHEGKVTKMSFKELEDVTNKFSVPYDESIFGAVYEATRVNGDEVIVIKLKEQIRLSPAQFEGEVNRVSFKHNNILQLKGYCEEIHAGEVRERLLCYDLFQRNLGAIIYGGESVTQLDWEARYKIIKGICQALKYLHEECEDAPQVHMGITPTNIWLDDEMVPKLGACGLSRFFAEDKTQIYNKEIVEYRGYVAPEHVELTKMTTKSDIYSLGVLIVEIVTGQMCPSSDNGSAASFIANVHKTWMKDFHVATKYPSLDAECLQQVKRCIKIGVQCAQIRPDKRPNAVEIIPMLEKGSTRNPGFWNTLCSVVFAKK